MKSKHIHFLLILILSSLVIGYFVIYGKFKSSNISNYEIKKKEFFQEKYDGYIYDIVDSFEKNHRVITVKLTDKNIRFYDICSDNVNFQKNYIVQKNKDDKYLYINGKPVELYLYICNPN